MLSHVNSLHPPQNTPQHGHLYGAACVFLSQTDYLNNSINCKLCKQFLQILHEQFLGFHILIYFLKMFNKVMFLSFSKTKFQIIGPKYLIEIDPFGRVLICKRSKPDFECR